MPKTKQAPEQNAMAAGPSREGLQIKGRLWVELDGEIFMSWGRLFLLEKIDRLGSVSAAAKSMNMSFSHAWHLVERMNCMAKEPLVEKQAGGKGGGGAWLTPAGKRVLEDFKALMIRFQDWLDREGM